MKIIQFKARLNEIRLLKYILMPVNDECRAPWGYGKAWRDWASGRRICALIPFNWFFRYLRIIYHKLARGPNDKHERKIYIAGYDAGYKKASMER